MNYDSIFNPCLYNKPLRGIFNVPGCKSISHRALILPIACNTYAHIYNMNHGRDVLATKKALISLGATINTIDDNIVQIEPINNPPFSSPQERINVDMENSGTSARFLMGLIASINGYHVHMTGDDSLLKRPMDRVQQPLALMGANIQLTGSYKQKGTLPALISGTTLNAIEYTLPAASAQLKSAIILAALRANGTTTIIEQHPSRDHTENMLAYLGHPIMKNNQTIIIPPLDRNIIPSTNAIQTFHIPGDPSSAAFWCVAASIIKDSHIIINNINGNPYRTEYIKVLNDMGAKIKITTKNTDIIGEPMWDIEVAFSKLSCTVTEPHQSAALMDEFPILSIAALMADGVTHFKGVHELSIKESNRIDKISQLLKAVGARIECSNDDIIVYGKTYELSTDPIFYDTAYDHRMAMCAIILAKVLNRPLHYNYSDCIDTSFPTFRQQIC